MLSCLATAFRIPCLVEELRGGGRRPIECRVMLQKEILGCTRLGGFWHIDSLSWQSMPLSTAPPPPSSAAAASPPPLCIKKMFCRWTWIYYSRPRVKVITRIISFLLLRLVVIYFGYWYLRYRIWMQWMWVDGRWQWTDIGNEGILSRCDKMSHHLCLSFDSY